MIETDRLLCEPVTAAHAEVMYPVLTDERIYAFMPASPPESIESLRKRYEFLSAGQSPDGSEQWLNWMLFVQTTLEPIGFFQATLRPPDGSIAYVLNPAYQGCGYATEAGTSILAHLFEEFELARVSAEIDPRNAASIALVKRLGMRFLRHEDSDDDDVYEMTRAEWTAI